MNNIIAHQLEPFHSYIVLSVIGIILLLIYREVLKPAVGLLIAVLIFVVLGIIDASDAIAGLSNTSIVSLIFLIMIIAGIRKNFRLDKIFNFVFGKVKTYRGYLVVMMSLVASLSSVVQNTPLVAFMTPFVYDYGRKKNIAPSRLLIPMAFAVSMGGMITVIGTSTSMVLNGFMIDQHIAGLSGRDLLIGGIAVTVTGILFITFFVSRLLPDNLDMILNFIKNQREYLVEIILRPGSPLVNKTIKEAGLRNLHGVYLVEIERRGRIISPVEPDEVIAEEDIFIFAGDTENIMDLLKQQPGMKLPDRAFDYHRDKNEIIEVVLAGNSSIIGKTVKESNFRQRYDAAIIAVHRKGEKISGKIGKIQIKSSDVLLVYAGNDFKDRIEFHNDLFVISKVNQIAEPGKKKYYALAIIALAAAVLFLTKGLALFPSLLIIFSIAVGLGLINTQDLQRELDLELVAILVFSMALGTAMMKSGAGKLVADWMINLLDPLGNIGLLIGVMLVTSLLTQIIVKLGVIAVIFPIAFSISTSLGLNGAPFYTAIAFAVSGTFLTPIAYQTNMIIFGPGGYTFKDFFKAGFPVVILYNLVVFITVLLLYHNIFL
jgi:di/tricarboxylate transporter